MTTVPARSIELGTAEIPCNTGICTDADEIEEEEFDDDEIDDDDEAELDDDEFELAEEDELDDLTSSPSLPAGKVTVH